MIWLFIIFLDEYLGNLLNIMKWTTIKPHNLFYRKHVYGYDEKGTPLIGVWSPYGYVDIKDYDIRVKFGGDYGIHRGIYYKL